MSLADAVAELDKQAGEEEVKEVEVEEKEEEESPAKEEEIKVEKTEEKQVEPAKIEIPKIEPTPTDWYKLREETRRREAAEAEIERLKAAPPAPPPDREENPVGFIQHEVGVTKADLAELKEWKQKKEAEDNQKALVSGAVGEFLNFENQFKTQAPDYDERASYVSNRIQENVRFQNPGFSDAQVKSAAAHMLLNRASLAAQQGLNPAAALYAEAERMGYRKAEEVETKSTEKGTTLAKLAENKKKSTGMSGNGGNGKAFVGNDEFLKMTNAERMKLSESDWARLEAEG